MTDYGIYEDVVMVMIVKMLHCKQHCVATKTLYKGYNHFHNPRCVQVLSENIQLLCSFFSKASSLKINILGWSYIYII